MVYFIQAVSGGPIKIGTTVRLSERLRQLESEYGVELKVLAVAEGSYPAESELHKRFSHINAGGEWFLASDDLLDFIAHSASPWDGADERARLSTAKVDKPLITKAKFVADTRDIPLAEYLTELLRGQVDRDFAKAVKMVEGEGRG